ncbi:ABC transporter ATP-binding protein [Sedimentibacter sp. zth1]|uniref:ATP-binding cassette domain-containing protein n=1 Tax=Sedimentibacter sp. zth1 TaxID=2816908 RepID=UPI001A924A03|nr:ABC transporter ATP-binding protein [Sedimentibacter sp. zth1]QSX05751.1 ABC transporter ATP-binding protein [Sedimentibacter sp. zth1]
MNLKQIKKLIYSDLAKTMTVPLVFNLIEQVIASILTVYTAKVLGSFADSIFTLNIEYGLNNIKKIMICILIYVIVIPFIDLVCKITMLKGALAHDRILYARFLNKEYRNAMKLEAGEVQYRLEDDPIDFRGYWMNIITKYITVPLTFVYVLSNSLKISVYFTMLIFAISLIKLFVPMFTAKLESKYDLKNRQYNTSVRVYETEIATKSCALKMINIANAFIKMLDQLFINYFNNVQKKDITIKTVAENIETFINSLTKVITLIIGAIMVSNKSISAGNVATMIGFLGVFDIVLGDVSYIIKKSYIMKELSERISILYSNAEVLNGKKIDNVDSIELRNLSISYDDKKVFNNLCFKYFNGDKLALIGTNGSGKTTLLKLICGLLKEYDGSLMINAIEFYDISIESLRDKIAYAMQDPYLFKGTIRDNIRLGNLNATNEEIDEVIKAVGIRQIENRDVGFGRNDLSGGEKQRVSIARALLKNSKILILDEPSNNLDTDGKEWLKQFVKNSDRSIIFVSHDEDITNYASKVVYMK